MVRLSAKSDGGRNAAELVNVILETERLVLSTVTLDDVEAVASSWKLDEGPISIEEAQAKVRWMLTNHRQNRPGKLTHLCLAIIAQGSREIAGWCGLDNLDPARKNPVIFYLLKASYWGKGLASEAARALLDFAFCTLELEQVDGGAAFDNLASKRVMEKIGMRSTGIDAEGGHAFTLTRDEYFRARPGDPSPGTGVGSA